MLDDSTFYFESQLKIIFLHETISESYAILSNGITHSITFAKLKIMHPGIINPEDSITSLQEISEALTKDNLPVTIFVSNVIIYFDIIEPWCISTTLRNCFCSANSLNSIQFVPQL